MGFDGIFDEIRTEWFLFNAKDDVCKLEGIQYVTPLYAYKRMADSNGTSLGSSLVSAVCMLSRYRGSAFLYRNGPSAYR